MPNFTRRDFLSLSGSAALASVLSPAASVAAPPAVAPSPFPRRGAARLRLSLAAYSFRERFPLMRGKPNPKVDPAKAMSMFDFVDYCGAQGIDGAELTTYFFDTDTDEYLRTLRRHCFLRGVSISGTAIGNNFSFPIGPDRDREIDTTKKWIDRAALLGAPHIRVFAGVEKGISRAEADKLVISALEEVSDYAGRRGIFLGLENHDSIGTAATLLPMIKAVNSPWLGINLDSGNFRTPDPYKDFAECIPHSVNVQLKADIGHGADKKAADLPRLVRLLREGGYQGWVALEYEAAEDSFVAVPRLLQQLKGLLG